MVLLVYLDLTIFFSSCYWKNDDKNKIAKFIKREQKMLAFAACAKIMLVIKRETDPM